MIEVKILTFGALKDIIQDPLDTIFEGIMVGEYKCYLENRYPKLKEIAHYMIAINEEYVEDDFIIKNGHQVAIIPPVSGG